MFFAHSLIALLQFQVPRGSPQPKALRTDGFRWDANDLTRLLHKGDFCDQWNQHIATNMSRDGTIDIDAVLKKSDNKDKGEADYCMFLELVATIVP